MGNEGNSGFRLSTSTLRYNIFGLQWQLNFRVSQVGNGASKQRLAAFLSKYGSTCILLSSFPNLTLAREGFPLNCQNILFLFNLFYAFLFLYVWMCCATLLQHLNRLTKNWAPRFPENPLFANVPPNFDPWTSNLKLLGNYILHTL